MLDALHRSCGILPQAVPPASCRRGFLGALILLLFTTTFTVANEDSTPTSRVGLPFPLTEIYIPGGEVRPIARQSREPPIVIRLVEVKPAQDGHRYDFEIYGLEPGDYKLADWLEPVDPSKPATMPATLFTITTALPPGLPRPEELTLTPPKRIGGYRTALWVAGTLWAIGLLVLIFWRRKIATDITTTARPLSLAERLRALVTEASRGELDADQQAALERLILGHWRHRLPELASLSPAEGLSALRRHAQAGPLLLQVEQWLHAPNSKIEPDKIDELLAPYRD